MRSTSAIFFGDFYARNFFRVIQKLSSFAYTDTVWCRSALIYPITSIFYNTEVATTTIREKKQKRHYNFVLCSSDEIDDPKKSNKIKERRKKDQPYSWLWLRLCVENCIHYLNEIYGVFCWMYSKLGECEPLKKTLFWPLVEWHSEKISINRLRELVYLDIEWIQRKIVRQKKNAHTYYSLFDACARI